MSQRSTSDLPTSPRRTARACSPARPPSRSAARRAAVAVALALVVAAPLGAPARAAPRKPAAPAARGVRGVPPRVETPIDPKLRDAAREELRAALASADLDLRLHAVEGVKDALGRDGAEVILTRLKDPAPQVRYAALIASGELRLAGARPAALEAVNDPLMPLRIAARFTLHRLGDTRFSHDLEKTCRDPDVGARTKTAFVLGLSGEPSAAALLRPMQRDREAAVRLQVAEALWRLGDQDGLRTLVGATLSGYPDDQMWAFPALAATHDTRVADHVRVGLTSDYPEVQLSVARALGDLGSDEGYGIALEAVKSKNPMHRLLAAFAFGAIGRTDAQRPLAALLREGRDGKEEAAAAVRPAQVRLAAAVALLKIDAKAQAAADAANANQSPDPRSPHLPPLPAGER